MKLFSKNTGSKVNQLFKKAGGDVNKFFKKDGGFQKGFLKGASAIGSAGRVLGQGVKAGQSIVNSIDSSPFGVALRPLTSAARTGLGVAGLMANASKQTNGALKDVISGRNAGKITNNILERAKTVQEEGKNIKFV